MASLTNDRQLKVNQCINVTMHSVTDGSQCKVIKDFLGGLILFI